MEIRTLEEMLYSYPYCKTENKNIELEIERIDIIGINNISYDFKPKNSNKTSIVENEVLEREEVIKALKSKYRKNQILLEKIDNSLTILDPLEQNVIKNLYFLRQKNSVVADNLFVSYVYVSNLKKSALNKLQRIIK